MREGKTVGQSFATSRGKVGGRTLFCCRSIIGLIGNEMERTFASPDGKMLPVYLIVLQVIWLREYIVRSPELKMEVKCQTDRDKPWQDLMRFPERVEK